MPPENKRGLTGPVVRRAVTMRGTAGEPDPEALRPRTAETEAAAPAEEPDSSQGAGAHGEENPTAVVPVSPSVAGPASSEAASTTAGTGPTSTSSSEAGAVSSEEPAAAAKKGDDAGEGDAGSLTATAGGSPPGASEGDTGTGGDEPPSGRPTKALLAAAGIGGALLIAVPFLVMGGGHDDKTEPAAMAREASAQTLQKDEEEVAPGNYAPKSPPAAPSVKAEAPAPKKEARSPSAATSSQEAAQPAKKEPKKKKEVQKPFRSAAPVYSDMKRVLLRNLSTKMCADVPYYDKGKPNGPVNQFHCNGTDKDNQLWDFQAKYRGKGPMSRDLFQIVNRKDGLCMDLGEFGGRPAGTKVAEFYCNGTTNDNQLWWLEPRGGKSFWIHNYASNQQCLEVVSGAGLKTVDAPLDIQPCRAGNDSEWTLW